MAYRKLKAVYYLERHYVFSLRVNSDSNQHIFLFMMIVLIFVLGIIPGTVVQAQTGPTLILSKTIDGGSISAEVGEIIRYRIRFECSSLTIACGQLEITDVLDPSLTFLPSESSIPSGFSLSYSAGTVTITKDDNNFLDGTQFDAVIAGQVNYDLRPLPTDIDNEVNGRIDPPGPTSWINANPADAPTITVDTATVDWTMTKTLISPAVNPTVDTDVTYLLSLCPATAIGNVSLSNIDISDVIPVGAVFVSASDGGLEAGGVVTWPSIAGPIEPTACVDRTVTIRYPSSNFTAGVSVITNTASANGTYTGDMGGTIGPVSIDDDPLVHPIDPIREIPDYSKDDTRDPIGISGTGRFVLSLDTLATNYPSNSIVLMDTMPAELEVTEVTSGSWTDPITGEIVRATVQYSSNNGSSWTNFPAQPVFAGTNATYTAPVSNITNVRWVFEYDPDGAGALAFVAGLPYAWSFDTLPEIRFEPRSIATTADPPSGAPLPIASVGSTYDNCLQVSRTNSSGNPITDPCDIEEISIDGDVVLLQVYKEETPGTAWDEWDDPSIASFTADSNLLPGDTMRYVLTLELTEGSSIDLVNPTISDTLPADLTFVRNGSAYLDGVLLPAAQQPSFSQSGLNLTWTWNNPSPALTISPLDVGSRYLTVEFFARIPRGQAPGPRSNTVAVVNDSVATICEVGSQGTDTIDIDGDANTTEIQCTNDDDYVVERSAALRGEKWIRSTDSDNSVVVNYASYLPDASCPNGGTIGLTGSNVFTRYPCISQAFPEGALSPSQLVGPALSTSLDDFEYNLRIFNDGNVDMTEYVLYDILPYVGDTGSGGTLSGTARDSEFLALMRGPVTYISGPAGLSAGNFLIEYNNTNNPCRPEVFNLATGAISPAGCNNSWTTTWSASARSFRIRLISPALLPQTALNPELRFGVPMYIPADSPLVGTFDASDAESLEIAWNSFAHTGSYLDPVLNTRDLLASEPRRVGITIPERMSVGNRVWRDSDNSGTINAPDDTTPGIAGVTVNLYRDTNNDGVADGAAIATTITDSEGYYLFSNILYDSADNNNNRYLIGIPASNFTAGQPLENLRSSTGTPSTSLYTNPASNNGDSNDTGIDPVSIGLEVFSANFTLEAATEPTSEADLSNNDAHGVVDRRRGLNGEADNDSDLTIDFGFFGGTDIQFSLGNHVWYDNGEIALNTYNNAFRNDGIRQGTEPPVIGVDVRLYRDGNANGLPDAAELIRSDITDVNGFYLFDNLDEGTYFVEIPASEFADGQPLAGWYSSQITGTENLGVAGNTNTPNMDSDDNGIDALHPEITGIFSGSVIITRGVPEQLGESHISNEADPGSPANLAFNPTGWDGPLSLGRYGETDANSNLTIDFGFIPPLSLGNRVWFDTGAGGATFRDGYNNGLQDGTEVGASGVTVQLWQDSDGTAGLQLATDTLIDSVTTDSNGYYLFDRFPPATNYYIHIPASNFAGVLANYVSSYDAKQTTVPADDTEDTDDNGIDSNSPATTGITSSQINMSYTSEPVTPTNESDIPANTPANTALYGSILRGLYGQADNDSNLTFDFGFVLRPRSIGNFLWIDSNNDAQWLPGELPVPAGVVVSLYLDNDNNNQADDFGAVDAIAFDTTDANGYYLFDNLPPNRYLVGVDQSNFASGGLLEDYTSSTGNVDNALSNADNRDNGVDQPGLYDATLSPYGILSSQINLSAAALAGLPTGETGSGNTSNTLGNDPTAGDGTNSRGRYGELDADSDLTIDFGFYKAMSIGNRVWLDNGLSGGSFVSALRNDGIQNGTEAGIQNVRVELYVDDGRGGGIAGDGIPQAGEFLRFDTTDANGYYLFDGLPEANYLVVIPAVNFAAGAVLEALFSSEPTGTDTTGVAGNPTVPNTDMDDNGIDEINPAVNGVHSGVIVLALDSEPTLESDTSGNVDTTFGNDPTIGDGLLSRGRYDESDDNSALTVDFGFIPPLSIGNRVWLDDGASATALGGTDLSLYNDGIMNGLETPIVGVTLTLYRDNNGDGDFNDAGENVRTTTSDAAGYYLFDGLPRGTYIVTVDAANFSGGVLDNHVSSFGADSSNGDANDNGIDDTNYLANGISSNIISLDYDTQPTTGGAGTEDPSQISGDALAYGVDGRGRFGELDADSDLTIDFGFVVPPRSIGNRIWFDDDNSGAIDGAESGIAGVRVSLYLDSDFDGVPDDLGVPGDSTDDALRFDISDFNGYYLFDKLPATGYIVGVDAINFVAGEPLHEYGSSLDTYNNASNNTDSLDNGINQADPQNSLYGVISSGIDLSTTPFAAPTGETSSGDINTNPANNPTAGDGLNSIGRYGEVDANSDLTIDFGFFKSLSIGNRVWLDNGAGTNNNGIQELGELGIANVRVELWLDNGDGVFNSGSDSFLHFDISDTGGYYLFDGLIPNSYFIHIPASNFGVGGALVNYDSSSDPVAGARGDNQTDSDDNGVDENFPGINGVTSRAIALDYDTESPTDLDVSGDTGTASTNDPTAGDGSYSRGRNNESDDNSELTVDFGFIEPVYSLGNRIWFDSNNSGTIDVSDGANPGIANVRIFLYLDNGDGIFTVADALVAQDITDAQGYYLFETFNLQPSSPAMLAGNYWVMVDQLEFRIGGDLRDLYSSNPSPSTRPDNGMPPNDTVDNNDNGVYTNGDPALPSVANPQVGGVIASSNGATAIAVTISKNSEPVDTGSVASLPDAPATESDYSSNVADGPTRRGTRGQLDSNSNLTIDFGFYKPMSIGNRVWFDTDNSGTQIAPESGIPNVTVILYRDLDGSGTFDAGEQIATDITDASGYYLFDNLVPGNYRVEIPATNFSGAGALVGFNSSTLESNNDTDRDDNGINDVDPAANGIHSNTINLALDSQPVNETDTSGNINDGANYIGRYGETDANSDITVDFGFVAPMMSLGNRVWLDPNNNGLIDASEVGIANVAVSLYRDTNGDGLPDGPAIATDTSDANGYYLFMNLSPGQYIVGLNNNNFNAGSALNGLLGSTGNTGDTQVDSDDNGLDTRHPIYGMTSVTIVLALNLESSTETDLGPEGNGTNGETPPNSELTVDFGLYRPMSIGNRVWFDSDSNRSQNGSEAGVPNVTLSLYLDANSDGVPDGAAIATTTTDSNGHYLFDGLWQGTYLVEVDASNFAVAAPLESYLSTTSNITNNIDRNDNGIDDTNPVLNGIISNPITLTPNANPTAESDMGSQGNGSNGETDSYANLTVDFGFVGTGMSLGNRVWIDDGGTTGTARDGIQNGDEAGVQNVRVNLYRDNNNDGIPDGAALATTTTDASGHYLFDNLTPGSYLVELAASNFNTGAVLEGYGSTITGAADTDQQDNGIDVSNPIAVGIRSATVTLVLNTEPSLEGDIGAAGIGAGGVDANSNITVDFGLIRLMSIGNRVWFDTDQSSSQNGTEIGISGVDVVLFMDDGDGIFNSALDTVAGIDTTDSLGFYLFDGLYPDDYFVYIPFAEFAAGGTLEGFTNSTGADTGGTDRNDNGVDDISPATNGIVSNLIILAFNTEPTIETDLSGDVLDGANFIGRNGESNRNSDVTIDFGFYAAAMSLGNRVWLDDGGTTGIANNGIQDGDEVGVAGVIVNLYTDNNLDGLPDGAIVATTTTDSDGHYLFDGLAPGNYLVQIAPANFVSGAALFGLLSSSGASNNDTDSNDNGIDRSNPFSSGIFSDTIILVSAGEPIGETDIGAVGIGAGGDDTNSNITVDFGFVAAFDLSDNPNSYGTTYGANGAAHQIIANLYMGLRVDDEPDGQPTVGADGDDDAASRPDDEDGVTLPVFVAGNLTDVEVTVLNNTGSPATLVAWIDFDGNGTFEATEGVIVSNIPSQATAQAVILTFDVPIDADVLTAGVTYARFRLTLDPLTTGDPTGTVNSGEVEDYLVQIAPPGLSITKTDGKNSIVVGQSTTYTITVTNSGVDVINRNFQDNIPTTLPDGFDPATVSWTCSASSGASCISGTPNAAASGLGPINEFIDVPRGGRIVYTITGTLGAGYSLPTVTNAAELIGGPRAEDIDGVIFDPPNGTKVGVVLGGDVIRWTMVWINTAIGPQSATVTDPIVAPQSFLGNLTCTAFGASTTTACDYVAASNQVTWSGVIDVGTINRVEISFDVRVPGAGTYRNTGTIDIGGSSSSASSVVTINANGNAVASPGLAVIDPAIVKLVDPIFAQAGDVVTWTILATNPNDVPLSNIKVVDDVPAELDIISTSSSSGTVTVSGQVVTLNIGTMLPHETVTLTIVTRIRPDALGPIIDNLAELQRFDGSLINTASAQVGMVSSLPATGETKGLAFWYWLLTFGILAVASLSIGRWWQLRRQNY
jgi:uncharacterized repeat protein (TIGR01451 family)